MNQQQNQGGIFGFAKNIYQAGKKVFEVAKPVVEAISAFILELEGENYKISMKDVGPQTDELLRFIEKYRLDKLHELIRDASWTIVGPNPDTPYFDLKLIVGARIDPIIVEEIEEDLAEYGQVYHTVEPYDENYIEEFKVRGDSQILDEVFLGLKLLDEAYHRGEVNYIYSAAWKSA